MEITPALAADLAKLNETFDDPDVDIAETLRQLALQAKLAVDSFLGLTVTIATDDGEISLSLSGGTSATEAVTSSLMIPVASTGQLVSLVLLATAPGAFVDLAADLSWLTELELVDFRLDQHLDVLHSSAAVEGVSGLDVISEINQAIGVLVEQGYTLEEAEAELGSRAAAAGVDRLTAAHEVIADLARADPPTDGA